MKGASRKKYAVAAGIGTAIFLLLTFVQGGFAEEDPEIRWRILCDALFVPGILLGSFGLLLFAAGGGVFDMLKYGTIKAFSFLMPIPFTAVRSSGYQNFPFIFRSSTISAASDSPIP